jgi:hypothetical protein
MNISKNLNLNLNILNKKEFKNKQQNFNFICLNFYAVLTLKFVIATCRTR